jgi:hypothetical protein
LWFAAPSTYETCIHYTLPIFTGAQAISFESLNVTGQSDYGKTWFRNGFVTGHDFSRAEKQTEKVAGFSPCGLCFQPLRFSSG